MLNIIVKKIKTYIRKDFVLLNSQGGRKLVYWLLREIHKKDTLKDKEMAKDILKISHSAVTINHEKGYELFPAGTISCTKAIVDEAKNIFELADKNYYYSKKYLQDIPIDKNLQHDSPFLKFALNEQVISIVTQYLGVSPVLREIKLRYSPNDDMQGGSQLFHTDKEDIRSMKVFIFINDVDENDGPLTAISASASEKVIQQLCGQWGSLGRVSDEEVFSRVESEDIQTLYGPSGTVAFLDVTRCLHYGSRPNPHGTKAAKPRLILWFLYHSRTALRFPFSIHGNPRFPFYQCINDKSSDIERFILS